MGTPRIETDRLLLREIQETDVNDIFDCWMQDEDVSRYMCWKASLIGTCLVFYNEDDDNSHWDISYNLGKKYWGNGYATEAMKAVMHFAEEELVMEECVTSYAGVNTKSANVLHKLRFVDEAEIPYECNGGEMITVGILCRYKRQ